MSANPEVCSKSDCPVAKTGECALQKDPVESCPNYHSGNMELDAADLSPDPGLKLQPVPIRSSDVMLIEDLLPFMQRRQISTVALIGEQRAGKTTLLSSIYQQFCRGRFGGVSFAGSETLVGFAKRHHLALLSSGRTNATVPRTSRDDPVSFFHLCLQREAGDLIDLILSDRSGEAYGAARTDTSLIAGLTELSLANRACFLLDGAKLASKDDRPAYSRHFKQMIHALHDNGALDQIANVEVLATKFDVTNSQADVEQQTDYLNKYEKQLIAEFAEDGLAVQTHRICALPKADHRVGFKGLDQLIQRWTEKPLPPSVPPRPIGDTPRQVDRLLAHIERAPNDQS